MEQQNMGITFTLMKSVTMATDMIDEAVVPTVTQF